MQTFNGAGVYSHFGLREETVLQKTVTMVSVLGCWNLNSKSHYCAWQYIILAGLFKNGKENAFLHW